MQLVGILAVTAFALVFFGITQLDIHWFFKTASIGALVVSGCLVAGDIKKKS